MNRGANKENLGGKYMRQGSFSNNGGILPASEIFAKHRLPASHETKLQNFLKNVHPESRNLHQSETKTKSQNSRTVNDSMSILQTTTNTEHTRRDQFIMNTEGRYSADPLADNTGFHLNKERSRSANSNAANNSRSHDQSKSSEKFKAARPSLQTSVSAQIQPKKVHRYSKSPQGTAVASSQEFGKNREMTTHEVTGKSKSVQKQTPSSSSHHQLTTKHSQSSVAAKQINKAALYPQTPSPFLPSEYGEYPTQSSQYSNSQHENNTSKEQRSSERIQEKESANSYNKMNLMMLQQFLKETHLKELLQMDIEEVKNIRQQNRELEATVKQLRAELQNERSKTMVLQNEIANLNGCMEEERLRYQNELLNISSQIKKLRNIQDLYVGEKKTSEHLENQLNLKDQKLKEINRFLKETIETVVEMMRNLLFKQEIRKIPQTNEGISSKVHESVLKLVQEVRKNLLGRLEQAEKIKVDYDWESRDYRELLTATKQQLKNFYERKGPQQLTPEKNKGKEIKQEKSTNSPNDGKINHSKSQSELDYAYHASQAQKLGSNSDAANFGVSKSMSDLRRDREQRLETQTSQQIDFQKAGVNDDSVINQARFSVLEAQEENKYNQDELLLNDQPLEYSFEGNDKVEEKELSHFFDGFSKIQTQNLDASSLFFGKTGFNFNISNNQSMANAGTPDTISQQATERRSTRPMENYQPFVDRQKINIKNYDMPFSNMGGAFEQQQHERNPNGRNQHNVWGQNNVNQLNAQSNQIAEESREETLDNTLPMSYSDFEYKQPGNSAMKSKSQPLETQERVQKTLTPSANKDSCTNLLAPEKVEQTNNEYETQNSELGDSEIQCQFAIAKFDYNAQRDNDLSFNRGDKIQVLRRAKNGWWIGLCYNKIGYFPYNFVQLLPEGRS